MSKKYIVANWKMAPGTWAEAEQILDFVNDYLAQRLSSEALPALRSFSEGMAKENESSLVFCPPFVFLEEVGKILKTSHFEHEASLGAQDIFWEDTGTDTGEISGPMLNKLGVEYVIIGHSERRWKLDESDDIVNKKLKAALRNEIIPIVCLGERVRDNNFREFLKEQVEKTFADLNHDELEKCMIAYEPIWAISSNPGAKSDTPESAVESIKIIKDFLTLNSQLSPASPRLGRGRATFNFLYGGSVNSSNAAEFLGQKEIDGVLVGGASVNKEEFVKILSQI